MTFNLQNPGTSVLPQKSTVKNGFVMRTFKSLIHADEFDIPPGLPEGWRRRCVMRKSGASAGQYDVYYYSPDGRRFRSKPEILKFMEKVGQSVDISVFDFRKKKLRDRPLSRMATPLKSSTVRSPTEYSHSKYTITNELQLPPKSQALSLIHI